jgi:hydrogenase maturation protease
MAMSKRILILGWGNPSRGDDALGPLFVEHIDAPGLPDVECLTDFQLQVEHALDLAGRQLVLFVDASLEAEPPFAVSRLSPARDASISSHALSPEAVMQVHAELHHAAPPPCYLLAIRGESFGLGQPCSPAAQLHLAAALEWFRKWLKCKLVNFSRRPELTGSHSSSSTVVQ